jgi:hypothetical protein
MGEDGGDAEPAYIGEIDAIDLGDIDTVDGGEIDTAPADGGVTAPADGGEITDGGTLLPGGQGTEPTTATGTDNLAADLAIGAAFAPWPRWAAGSLLPRLPRTRRPQGSPSAVCGRPARSGED